MSLVLYVLRSCFIAVVMSGVVTTAFGKQDIRKDRPKLSAHNRVGSVDISGLIKNIPQALSVKFAGDISSVAWTNCPDIPLALPFFESTIIDEPLPLVLTLMDVVSNEQVILIPDRVRGSGSKLYYSGKALDVEWDLIVEPGGAGELCLTGRISSDKDRCIRVGIGCKLNLSGWTWHDDFHFKRDILDDQTIYRNIGASIYGYAAEQSLFPFGVISKGDSGGIMIETDPYEPRILQIYAEPSKDFFGIYYDMGLTRRTSKFPGQATFRCRLRSIATSGNKEEFREALSGFYARYPEFKVNRTKKVGLWMPFSDISKVCHPEDFHFAFLEKVGGLGSDVDYCYTNDILTMVYTEPWLFWLPVDKSVGWNEKAALDLMSKYAVTGNGRLNRFSSAAMLGAVQDIDGKRKMTFLDTPWSSGARMEVNTDPELPTTSLWKVNRAMAEWYFIRNVLKDKRVDGIYLDSMSAMLEMNYDSCAMAVTDYPCTFGLEKLKPGLATAILNYKFIVALSRYLHKHGKFLMGNFPCWNFPFYMPFIDIPGEETTWFGGGRYNPMDSRQLNFRRAISGDKPYGFLQATLFDKFKGEPMRRYFMDCLFYAFMPSFFSHDAASNPYWENPRWLKRDRHMFKTYMPLIDRLALAGWEPKGFVHTSVPDIWIEHFGSSSDRIRYITIRNSSSLFKKAELSVENITEAIVYDPLSGWIKRVKGNSNGVASIKVGMSPGQVAMRTFVSISELSNEIKFVREWKSGDSSSSASLLALESVKREIENRVDVFWDYPLLAWSDASNIVNVSINNCSSNTLWIRGGDKDGIKPGDNGNLSFVFSNNDSDAEGWIKSSFVLVCGTNEFICSRMYKPVFVPQVVVDSPDADIYTFSENADMEFVIRNYSSQAHEIKIFWDGDHGNGVKVDYISGYEVKKVSLTFDSNKQNIGLMQIKVCRDDLPIFEKEFSVHLLRPGSSLARDSRVSIVVDSTFSGYGVKPLTDGVTDVSGLMWNEAAWASAETPLPHWVRITFPKPVMVKGATIHWNVTSRNGAFYGYTDQGKRILLANFTNKEDVKQTKLIFKSVKVKAVEFFQSRSSGSKERPNLMWLNELEVY